MSSVSSSKEDSVRDFHSSMSLLGSWVCCIAVVNSASSVGIHVRVRWIWINTVCFEEVVDFAGELDGIDPGFGLELEMCDHFSCSAGWLTFGHVEVLLVVVPHGKFNEVLPSR
eukprot:scaffold254610_cov43-Attheya_sp.AAC.1